MLCPRCGVGDSKVTSTVHVKSDNTRRRTRVCKGCDRYYYTVEFISHLEPRKGTSTLSAEEGAKMRMRVQQWLLKTGHSRAELAKRANISRQALHYIMTGRSVPNVNTYRKLLFALET